MREFQDSVLIICKHSGSLIEYSRFLNHLGVFSLLLCLDEDEALLRVDAGASFSHLVYDAFNFDADGCATLKKLCASGQKIILLSEATETQCLAMQQWAVNNHLSIHILPRPVPDLRLIQILNLHIEYPTSNFDDGNCERTLPKIV